ncbi:MAG TPA: GTP cyclohydrolase FolE2 [Phycisphaerales bacterium]|nr:GTP cyclohydrolase FolE2 [Phycisphaerales bacterium]
MNTSCQCESSREACEASIPDVQGRGDHRQIAIDQVGVKDVRYPISVRTRDGGHETVDTTIDMFVSLPGDRKGTHMSRFLEMLNDYRSGMTPNRIVDLGRALCDELDAATSRISVRFTYFIEKNAPASGKAGLMNYAVEMTCDSTTKDHTFTLQVAAPATSLCPCSKEISEYGAHNQRCLITAAIRMQNMVWIEDLVEHIESAASAPVYSVLKRVDEKVVTEQAYDNPKFVEDIVRDLAMTFEADDRINWYHVQSENYESIHSHNAYAEIQRSK